MNTQEKLQAFEYDKIDEIYISDSSFEIWYSKNIIDELWDSFIYSIPGSSYEQMSLWSQVKSLSGWNFVRVIITSDNKIAAGFQILWQQRKIVGRIGYISKGPLIADHHPRLQPFILNLIKSVAKKNKISALLVLPNNKYDQELNEPNFLPNRLVSLIEATTVIDLTQTEDIIKKRMPYMRRKNIKIVASSGSRFREGRESELEQFFSLMLETCIRQDVTPNPPSVEILRKIWELFNLTNRIKLFFLEFENKIITGCLVFLYQDKFYAWKIGWSGEAIQIKPNDAIHWFMILWAKEHGYKYYDFGSVDINHAGRVQRNESIPPEIRSTPSYFKLSFGGDVVCFPKSSIYIPNPILRGLYRIYLLIKK